MTASEKNHWPSRNWTWDLRTSSLDRCSTNLTNESDGEEHWYYNHRPSVQWLMVLFCVSRKSQDWVWQPQDDLNIEWSAGSSFYSPWDSKVVFLLQQRMDKKKSYNWASFSLSIYIMLYIDCVGVLHHLWFEYLNPLCLVSIETFVLCQSWVWIDVISWIKYWCSIDFLSQSSGK